MKAGETLKFVVAIGNPTSRSVRFETCPAYRMSFGESSESTKPVESLLNCDVSDSIAAGEEQRFAMEIEVPAAFEVSTASIYWRLESTNAASSGSIGVT